LLASRNRLTRSTDFARVVRRGRRGSSSTVVVHWLCDGGDSDPRAGFVVGKAVGGAVVRKHVTRRLRALVRSRLASLPAGGLLVVRALPSSSSASYAALADDLDRALRRCIRVGLSDERQAIGQLDLAQVSR
jgi:ribonuclease P protein component